MYIAFYEKENNYVRCCCCYEARRELNFRKTYRSLLHSSLMEKSAINYNRKFILHWNCTELVHSVLFDSSYWIDSKILLKIKSRKFKLLSYCFSHFFFHQLRKVSYWSKYVHWFCLHREGSFVHSVYGSHCPQIGEHRFFHLS